MGTEQRSSGRVRLTQKMIEALPPNPPDARRREREYADADAVGLRVSVSKGSRKFFDYRYKHNGRKRCLRLGCWPGMSLQEARDRARECRNMLYRGIDPAAERDKRASVMTFAEFIEREYLPFARSKKSVRDDIYKLNRDLLPLWGKLPLTAIATKDVQALCTRIREESSPTYANRYYSLIHRIFNLAILWGRLDGRNPAKGVAKAKESGGRERFLTGEEIVRFLGALRESKDLGPSCAIQLCLFTGMRRGEVLGLTWADVDFDRKSLFLAKTKSGKSRTVVLNDLAADVLRVMLERRREECPWVFPGNRPGGHLVDVRGTFDAAKARAGITGLRLHDLRHTFASLAVQQGSSLYEVQTLLGHSSSAMTQRYSHLGDSHLRAVTDGVASQITQVTG